MASYQFLVQIEIVRESGKFATRDEIVEGIIQNLESMAGEQVDGIGADGDSVYIVEDYSIDEYVPPKKTRVKRETR